MRLVRVVFGLVAAGMLLSGCGSSDSSTSSASTSSAPPPQASTSTASQGSNSSTPTGSASLSWTAPTLNTNGSALTDLAGFHIHYGTSAASLIQEVDVQNAGTESYTVSGLGAGTWYFAISAYTTDGVESGMSTVGSKTIT
ncbi:MAG: fibronectin type III domain-containing protein [Acetobacteraceae bacterium]